MSSQGDCALCLESLWSNSSSNTPNALGTCVPCGHVLHKDCYAKWQASSYFHDACPFCGTEEVEFMPLFLNFPVPATAAQSTSEIKLAEEAVEATTSPPNNKSSEAALRSDSSSPPSSTSLPFSSSLVEAVSVTTTAPSGRITRSGCHHGTSSQTRTNTTRGRRRTPIQLATRRSGRRLVVGVSPNDPAAAAASTPTSTTGSVHHHRRRPKRRRQDGSGDSLAFPDVCLELWNALVGSSEETTPTTGTPNGDDAVAVPRRSRRNVIHRGA